MLLSLDPGADAGWGLFKPSESGSLDKKARLISCGMKIGAKGEMPEPATVTAYYSERPVYYGAKSKVPARDLITLSLRAGEAAGPYKAAGIDITYYEPGAWKGSVPKQIHHSRLWAKLDANEQEVVREACKKIVPTKRHNLMDGIGIGLFALGRVGVGGV